MSPKRAVVFGVVLGIFWTLILVGLWRWYVTTHPSWNKFSPDSPAESQRTLRGHPQSESADRSFEQTHDPLEYPSARIALTVVSAVGLKTTERFNCEHIQLLFSCCNPKVTTRISL